MMHPAVGHTTRFVGTPLTEPDKSAPEPFHAPDPDRFRRPSHSSAGDTHTLPPCGQQNHVLGLHHKLLCSFPPPLSCPPLYMATVLLAFRN